MSHRQNRLYADLMLSIRNNDEPTPCYTHYWTFNPEGNDVAIERADRAAKEICQDCPVINKCLDYALSANEPVGVWGGLTTSERQSLLDAKKYSRLNR